MRWFVVTVMERHLTMEAPQQYTMPRKERSDGDWGKVTLSWFTRILGSLYNHFWKKKENDAIENIKKKTKETRREANDIM